ncbi:MAG: hypothetical protein HYV02_06310 [Deltaproteobacteria bacterium]|nr:hypothetical protein [Deltaproteobacteria bacterium]
MFRHPLGPTLFSSMAVSHCGSSVALVGSAFLGVIVLFFGARYLRDAYLQSRAYTAALRAFDAHDYQAAILALSPIPKLWAERNCLAFLLYGLRDLYTHHNYDEAFDLLSTGYHLFTARGRPEIVQQILQLAAATYSYSQGKHPASIATARQLRKQRAGQYRLEANSRILWGPRAADALNTWLQGTLEAITGCLHTAPLQVSDFAPIILMIRFGETPTHLPFPRKSPLPAPKGRGT